MYSHFTRIDSPIGVLTLACDGECEKLTGLWIEGQRFHGDVSQGTFVAPSALPLFARTQHWLTRYFAGEAPSPEEIPVNLSGTDFRQKVWRLLTHIPYGRTTTYGMLAHQLTPPGKEHTISARAVGSAIGHNPVALVVPCHRVLGCRGTLTGFAAGLEVKLFLLRLESALLPQ